jgi:hypothetical protein
MVVAAADIVGTELKVISIAEAFIILVVTKTTVMEEASNITAMVEGHNIAAMEQIIVARLEEEEMVILSNHSLNLAFRSSQSHKENFQPTSGLQMIHRS